MGKRGAVDEDRLDRVAAALDRLGLDGCPAVPQDPSARTDLAARLLRRFDSVDRRRRADDRARFLDLIRAVDGPDNLGGGSADAECVAAGVMAALEHPVPGMRRHP
jgi:hypothetical protein